MIGFAAFSLAELADINTCYVTDVKHAFQIRYKSSCKQLLEQKMRRQDTIREGVSTDPRFDSSARCQNQQPLHKAPGDAIHDHIGCWQNSAMKSNRRDHRHEAGQSRATTSMSTVCPTVSCAIPREI